MVRVRFIFVSIILRACIPNAYIRVSVVVSVSACHADDLGSIPGRRTIFCYRVKLLETIGATKRFTRFTDVSVFSWPDPTVNGTLIFTKDLCASDDQYVEMCKRELIKIACATAAQKPIACATAARQPIACATAEQQLISCATAAAQQAVACATAAVQQPVACATAAAQQPVWAVLQGFMQVELLQGCSFSAWASSVCRIARSGGRRNVLAPRHAEAESSHHDVQALNVLHDVVGRGKFARRCARTTCSARRRAGERF